MFEEFLRKLSEELDRREIDYVVIGGQALLLYGEPRLTKDIDVTPEFGKVICQPGICSAADPER